MWWEIWKETDMRWHIYHCKWDQAPTALVHLAPWILRQRQSCTSSQSLQTIWALSTGQTGFQGSKGSRGLGGGFRESDVFLESSWGRVETFRGKMYIYLLEINKKYFNNYLFVYEGDSLGVWTTRKSKKQRRERGQRGGKTKLAQRKVKRTHG